MVARLPLPRFISTERVEKGHWSVAENRRAFLDAYAATNGIQTVADWSQVGQRDIIAAGGGGLLHRFGNSLAALLKDAYPDAAIAPRTLGSRRPRGHWAVPSNRRAFLEDIARQLQLSSPQDWRTLRQSTVRAAGGHGLLSYFHGSMTEMIVDSFPHMKDALAPRQRRQSRGHWLAVGARRQFLLQLAKEKNIESSSPQGWHALTSTMVRSAGGGGLLAAYGGSLHAALADSFPELAMEDPMSCRQRVPRGHWGEGDDALDRAAAFVRLAAKQLGLDGPEDWYRASYAQIREVPGCGVLRKVRLIDALAHAFPDLCWEEAKLASRTKRSAQRGLRSCLRLIMAGSQRPAHEHPALR